MDPQARVREAIEQTLRATSEVGEAEERARQVVRAALQALRPDESADAIRHFPEAVRLTTIELGELAGRSIGETASELVEVLAVPLEYARLKGLHEYPRRVQDAVHTAAIVDDLGRDFREAILKVLPVFEREMGRKPTERP